MGSIVDRWNAAYFDNRLSRGAPDALVGLKDASADAQALADRIFRLMRVARFDAKDLSIFTAWVIGVLRPPYGTQRVGRRGTACHDAGSQSQAR
jgi:hypothetical protein